MNCVLVFLITSIYEPSRYSSCSFLSHIILCLSDVWIYSVHVLIIFAPKYNFPVQFIDFDFVHGITHRLSAIKSRTFKK